MLAPAVAPPPANRTKSRVQESPTPEEPVEIVPLILGWGCEDGRMRGHEDEDEGA